MSLLDPQERSARGTAIKAEVTGNPAPEPQTPLEESWRDFVYAEVWSRPGLDRRARYLVALAGAAFAASERDLELYVEGALKGEALTVTELREAALHLAVYGGWSRGGLVDSAVSRVAERLGLPAAERTPIRAAPWDPQVRSEEGAQEFINVMTFPGGPPATPYLEAIRNFVFGEMWCRYDGLDQRSRRWLTLVGVCESGAETPIRTHIHAAMASGNCKPQEMQEFVLQYGIHAGWPKASVIQGVVFEMIKKIEAGLPHDA
ncbi:MAG: carboxymuconolactone decarboxylase family protein [Novosphingobium sp.]|nr:carboxymuconolactone decarboxylase family protein [Novosphingobium sp.]